MGILKWALLPLLWVSFFRQEDQGTNATAETETTSHLVVMEDSIHIPYVEEVEPKWSIYKDRYVVADALSKITDNFGNGFDDLYGTRNMRVVIHGAAYRGGANNYFHRNAKRHNHNPLPLDALENLCSQGFSRAIYLYRTRFSTAPDSITCDCEGEPHVLKYEQLDYSNAEHLTAMFQYIQESATDDQVGPLYIHCWNGWHASGQIAALSLRQFCDMSAEDAVRYWIEGTDGAHNHPSYDRIKSRIRNFTPTPEISLDSVSKECMCPDIPEDQ